ncbi:hypothetical protein M426DRAFT_240105 [Hypoxylon sp. CI-4A]|nr:hypothetical protein M426DRAFT_240105 [Hypoxylon sp. CI-4A]
MHTCVVCTSSNNVQYMCNTCAIQQPVAVIGGIDRWTTGGSEPHNLHNSSIFAKAPSTRRRWCSAATLHSQSLNAVQPSRDAESFCASPWHPSSEKSVMECRYRRPSVCAVDHIRHSVPFTRKTLRLTCALEGLLDWPLDCIGLGQYLSPTCRIPHELLHHS